MRESEKQVEEYKSRKTNTVPRGVSADRPRPLVEVGGTSAYPPPPPVGEFKKKTDYIKIF